VLEGTYPFVSGGVSSWTHDLLRAQNDLRFHLVCLAPPDADLKLRYELPANVLSVTVVAVGKVPERHGRIRGLDALLHRLEPHLARIVGGGSLADVAAILR
jgi:hypothetical protein